MKKIVFDCQTGQSEEVDDPNWVDLPDQENEGFLSVDNPLQILENKIEDLQKQLQSMQEIVAQTVAPQAATNEQNNSLTTQQGNLQSTSGLSIPEPPWNN